MQTTTPCFGWMLGAALLLAVSACQSRSERPAVSWPTATPPVATVQPETLRVHGDTRIDPYYWLRNRDSSAVRDYLQAENAYFDSMMAPLANLREAVYAEMVSHIQETDTTPLYRLRGQEYYRATEKGKQYAVYYRKASPEAQPEILLDVNALGEGKAYYNATGPQLSLDDRIIAYADDTLGYRRYTLRFRDRATGKLLAESIPNTSGNFTWAADHKTVFYTVIDPTTNRSYKVFRHTLGTPVSQDAEVFHEAEEQYSVYVGRSKNDRFVYVFSSSTLSSEQRYVDAQKPNQPFQVIHPREKDLLYQADQTGTHFVIRTNADGATNFKLVTAPVDRPGRANWQELVPHNPDVLIEDFDLFRDYSVVQQRSKGLTQLRVIPNNNQLPQPSAPGTHDIDFPDPAYAVYAGSNPEFASPGFRFVYTSLVSPTTTFEYDVAARKRNVVKQVPVPGYDPSRYASERIMAPAADGTPVPVSLVYRKDKFEKNANPLLVYAYGSYGNSTDATFNSQRISLLDRGFVYAIAHVRGGEDMGRQWYLDGKLLKKKNTFTDFVDCTKHLVSQGYTDGQRVYAMGGSAGGLLIGAVANMAPELYHGMVAAVPFVDVVTTMLDASIPLTTLEYDEWGNPNDSTYYRYMLSYSPYDQVAKRDYPNLLVFTSLYDSQVQYWEPAKWVAKLRTHNTGANKILFQCEMSGGHSGPSGRYEAMKRNAMYYAWMLHLAGAGGAADAPTKSGTQTAMR